MHLTQRVKTLAYSAVTFSVLLAPSFASAAVSGAICIGNFCIGGSTGGNGFGNYGCDVTICRIGATLLYIINGILVPLLFAVAFIVFLYGVADTYILSRGDADEVTRGHTLILWGIIGFAIMISIWGLVNVVANTFGLSNQTITNELPYSP